MHPPSSCQIIPNEPAVIPILIIPKNSNRPIDSTGIESIVVVTASGIIPAKLNRALPEVVAFQ